MTALIAMILLLALVLGGVGLFIEGLFWLAVIALLLIVVGGVLGMTGRRSRV